MSLRRLLPLAAVTLCVAPAPATALTISGTTVKTLPETAPLRADSTVKDIIYYLDLHAGPSDERFSVVLTPPDFATSGARDEGRSVDGPKQFTLYGPGTVGTLAQDPAFGSLCSARADRYHGYTTGTATIDVALPAEADTTLAIRYSMGRRAPWSDTDLALKYAFQPRLIGNYDASSPLFGAATSVADAGPPSATRAIPIAASGRSKIGAHLILETTPKGTYGTDGGRATSASSSRRIAVRGRLLPATAKKRVLLHWAKPGGPLRTAGTLTTSGSGRFSTTLKPPGKGGYELWATYPKQPGQLAADSTSCPLRFAFR